LNEKEYLKYVNEIDYYTGLERGEKEIVSMVLSRLEDSLFDVKQLIGTVSVDDFFATKNSIVERLAEADLTGILSEKPSEEELDGFQDTRLDLKASPSEIRKKGLADGFQSLTRSLALTLRVIRNSEELDEGILKEESYKRALKCLLYYSVLFKLIMTVMKKTNVELSKGNAEDLNLADNYLPLLMQINYFENIGTAKLLVVIREKIESDKTSDVSELEKYFSVFLYSDIRGAEYEKVIGEFIKSITKKYIKDMTLFKLITYFYARSKNKASDQVYLNHIADLFISSGFSEKKDKSEIIQRLQQRRKSQDLDGV
jgi:hypothetical protein